MPSESGGDTRTCVCSDSSGSSLGAMSIRMDEVEYSYRNAAGIANPISGDNTHSFPNAAVHRIARVAATWYAAAARFTTKSEHISDEKTTDWFQNAHSGGSAPPPMASLGHAASR